jgi:6-phosphofructokinase 1
VLVREEGRSEEDLVEAVSGVIRRCFAERGKRRVLIIKAEGVEMPCTRLVRHVQEAMQSELPGLEIRATVLGHVVRGGNPSFIDRMMAGRLALAAVEALAGGATDEMVAWNSPLRGGKPTGDPSVQRFSLERVLAETEALIDGTSPVTQRRLQMMNQVQGVLPL